MWRKPEECLAWRKRVSRVVYNGPNSLWHTRRNGSKRFRIKSILLSVIMLALCLVVQAWDSDFLKTILLNFLRVNTGVTV